MDKLIGLIINSLAFAQEQKTLAGEVAPAELPRLKDSLADEGGSLNWRAAGTRDEQGRRCLDIAVDGVVDLTCQRCLEMLPYAVASESRLLLIAPGEPWPDESLEDDSADAIEALARQPLAALIEDEVLLALPAVPRHASCRPPVQDDEQADDADGRELPLRELSRLRRQTPH